MSDELNSSAYSWGQSVQIKADAPTTLRRGSIGEVCGIRRIESISTAAQFRGSLGDYLYIIEFTDGDSMEVLERDLQSFD